MDRRGDGRSPGSTATTAMCIAGLAVSGSILILLVPTLLQAEAQVHPLVVVGLVVLSGAFGAGARHWEPQDPGGTSASDG